MQKIVGRVDVRKAENVAFEGRIVESRSESDDVTVPNEVLLRLDHDEEEAHVLHNFSPPTIEA